MNERGRGTADVATLALSAALLVGGFLAWRVHWTSDDAFVSFRCARNLVRGHGLTFNAGEMVESYTNFLWTLLVAAGMRVGIEPIACTRALGVAALLGVALLVARAEERGATRARIPVAAIAWVLCAHARSFAVSGLETLLFTALVTATLAVLIEARGGAGFALAGLCAALAALTRPDGVLVLAPCIWIASLASVARRSPLPLLAGALPVLALHGPYVAWKLATYGSLLPNTFHAKAASDPYPDQGLRYVGLFLGCYWVLVPCVLIALAALARSKRSEIERAGWDGARAEFALGSYALLHLAYVVWVGGDFMFARFCLPAVPALLLLGSRALRRVARSRVRAACAAALVLGAAFPWIPNALSDGAGIAGIVEESRFGTPEVLDARREYAEVLARTLDGTGARLLIGGGMMSFAWFGDFPYVIDSYGLTDPGIARRSIDARGRVGHEKEVSVFSPYFAERGIDLAVPLGVVPQPPPEDPLAPLRLAWLDVPGDHRGTWVPAGARLPLVVLCHRPEVFARLRARGLAMPPFDAWLDEFIARVPELDGERARSAARALLTFHFEHADDAPRRERLGRALQVEL